VTHDVTHHVTHHVIHIHLRNVTNVAMELVTGSGAKSVIKAHICAVSSVQTCSINCFEDAVEMNIEHSLLSRLATFKLVSNFDIGLCLFVCLIVY